VVGVRREQTITIRHRFQRLEQEHRADGRSPQCRDPPEQVLRFFCQDSPESAPVPEKSPEDASEPCSAWGWSPAVTEIVEVVVQSREDVARLEALGRAR
jgi:hypothetical protein